MRNNFSKRKIGWLILSFLVIVTASPVRENASTSLCPPYASSLLRATGTANAASTLCAPDNNFASVGLFFDADLILDMGVDNQIVDEFGIDFYYYERSFGSGIFGPGILIDKVVVAVAQDDGLGNPGPFSVLFVWGDDNPNNNGTIPASYLPEIPNRLIHRTDLHNGTGIGIDIGNDDRQAYRFIRFQTFPTFSLPTINERAEVDAVESVHPINHAPVLVDPIGDQTVPLGSSLSLTLSATDPDGDSITFSAAPLPLPANMTLSISSIEFSDDLTSSSANGSFTFRPDASQVGLIVITFIASDTQGGSVSETVTITVEGPTPGAETKLTGRLLDTNAFVQGTETPVVGALVSLLNTGISTTSDANGNFMLTDIPAGSQILDIDTTTANLAPDGSPYAGFREEIGLIESVTNVVQRPFFLPRIDMASLTPVNPESTTVVNNPNLDITLLVPPNTAMNSDGTFFTGDLSISEVPGGWAPAALPPELDPGLLITIQPVGVMFATPVPITFPNTDNLAPGSETDIWSLDPETGTFVVVGIGQVSSNGQLIETISGGVRAADWHMALAPSPDGEDDSGDDSKACQVASGSRTSVASGNLMINHELVSYVSLNQPQTLRLVYNSLRADPQPIISLSTTILQRAAVPPSVSARLGVGGVDQGVDVFWNTGGLSESQDETIWQVVQFDASGFRTGVYPYQITLTSNYPRSSVSSVLSGTVVVNNQQKSLIGAGWSLDGLQQLHIQPDGSVLLTQGNGTSLHFSKGFLPTGSVRIVESGWNLIRAVDFANGQAAHFNPVDGLLYVGRDAAPGAGGGLYRISRDGSVVKVTAGDRLAAVVVDPDSGNVFFSEDFGGSIFHTAFGSTGRSTWIPGVTGFHPGDDDPVGMAVAPHDYTGSVISPGEALVVDRGFNGPDEIWRFSPDTPQGESLIHADDDTLIDAVDITIGIDDVYLVDTGNESGANGPGRIYRLGADGSLTLLATSEPITDPVGIAIDPLTQDLFVLDAFDDRLVRVNPSSGVVTTMFTDFSISGAGWAGVDVTPDGGQIFITDEVDVIYTFSREDAFQSPPGDFSKLVNNADGTFTRILKDGVQIHFNASGLQTSVVDRNGNTTIYTYDAEDRLITITDPVSLVTTFSYTNGLLASITDPSGRITSFTHDTAGNLRRITNPDGSSRQFSYDARHRMTSQTTGRGFTTTYEYDFAGRHMKSTLPDGSIRLISPSATVGLVDTFSGLGTEDIPAPLVRPEDVIATFTDGEGRTATFEVGQFGEATRITDSAGLVTQIDRDGDGNPVRIVLPSGHTVSQTYDSRGNLITSTDETVGGTIRFTYDPFFNQITSITDAQNQTSTIVYDTAGNPIRMTSPMSRTSVLGYDSRGLITSIIDLQGTETAFTYNAEGNLVEVAQATGPDQRVTTYTHTPEGYINNITDPLNRVFTFTFDPIGQLMEQMLPGDRAIEYAYDADGNTTSVTPPGRPPHTFGYIPTNDLELYTPPSVGPGDNATHYEYNFAQQLTRIVRPDGQPIDIGYDNAGRMETVMTPQGFLTFGFDTTTGLLTSVTDPSGGTLSYGYDGELLTHMAWVTGEVRGAVQGGYDASYRVSSLRVEGTSAVTYTYDADGLLETAGDLLVTRSPATGLATATTLGGVTESWGYDDFGEPNTYVAAHDGNVLYIAAYMFDAAGRVEQKTEFIDGNTHTFVYTYDLAGRLEEVTRDGISVEAYSYDMNDNRITQVGPAGAVTGSYDDQDRLTSYGAATYIYTANGELLTKTSGAETTTYDYDVLGNLRAVTLPDGTNIEYVVDGANRRVGKKVNGTLVQGFLYKDDLNPIAELDDNNQIVSVFVYGTRPNVPDYMIREGVTYRILSDHLGSPRLVVNVATGEVVARMDYDAFGNILQDTNPGFQPFGFAGGLYDPDTGLTRFGVRDYDAQVGRWMAKDPSLFRGGQPNLYVYAGSDPINNIDLDGRAYDTLSASCGKSPALCAAIFETGGAAVRAAGAIAAPAAKAAAATLCLTLESDTPFEPIDIAPPRAIPLVPPIPPHVRPLDPARAVPIDPIPPSITTPQQCEAIHALLLQLCRLQPPEKQADCIRGAQNWRAACLGRLQE